MSQISTEPCIREFPRRRPFPLEPRDPNACPRFSLQMASTRKADNENGSHSHKNAQNPLLQRMAGLEQDRRRQVYLKRVRQTSDDKKWESRSEQIMRQDFLARQRQWEMDQARAASEILPTPDEEQDEEPGVSKEVDMVDEIFSQEDQEVEELVSWMQRAEGNENGELARQSMSDYGSDDEEYDRLFTDVMTEVHEQKANDAETDSGQALDMDMSLG